MDKSFAIGIPTLNRMDLLAPALQIYLKDFSCHIFIVDNGHQAHPVQNSRIIWLQQEKNIGVAASWNLLCKTIFEQGHTHAIIANDDIIPGFGDQQILSVIKKHPSRLVTTIVDWCIFIIPQFVWAKTGPFDDHFFPAYYEDKDYERRLKLQDTGIVKSPMLSPSVYRSSMTAEKDNSVHVAAHGNRERYLKKWGGPPGGEIFLTPFNEKSKK